MFREDFALCSLSPYNETDRIMAVFSDLPLEILPLIIRHIVKAAHLASICLVNHSFYTFSVERLYDRVVIYPWYRDAKNRVRVVVTLLLIARKERE